MYVYYYNINNIMYVFVINTVDKKKKTIRLVPSFRINQTVSALTLPRFSSTLMCHDFCVIAIVFGRQKRENKHQESNTSSVVFFFFCKTRMQCE